MADINNIFNGLNSEDVGFEPRRQEPDAPVETIIPENVALDTETDTNILDAELEATNAETAIRLDVEPAENVISFEATEAEAFAILTAAFDEEGEFAPFEHHDAEAFDAMATSEAGKRYKLYLDNKDSNSVLTQSDTRNSNESFTRQMSRQIFADAMYSNLERIQEIDSRLGEIDLEISDLEAEMAEIERLLEEIRLQRAEAVAETERLQQERAAEEDALREDEIERAKLEEDVRDQEAAVAAAAARVEEAAATGTDIEQVRAEQEYQREAAALEETRTRLNTLKETMTAREIRLGEIDAAIEEKSQLIDELDRTAEGYEDRLSEIGRELESLHTERISLLEEKEAAFKAEQQLMQEDPEGYSQSAMSWLNELYEAGEEGIAEVWDYFSSAPEDTDLAAMQGAYLDNMYNTTHSQVGSAKAELQTLRERLAELESEMDDLTEERDQALNDSAYDMIGAADFGDMGFTEIYENALTVTDESGITQFKIMANFDAEGNVSGIMVSDGRVAMQERATQHATPLENYSPEDQEIILSALAEARLASPDGSINLVDAAEFNSRLDASVAASAAIARNDQYNSTYGQVMNGTTRLEAVEASVEIVAEEIAETRAAITAAASDGDGIQTETKLTAVFTDADIPRDEPLDNPTPATPDQTTDWTLSPIASVENFQLS